ncbi:MAG TPA: hypothetical protein VNO52_17700 [Methylomirabilota bacterium]|nr:hypothetical protein [Methylomirabilota bacterium]
MLTARRHFHSILVGLALATALAARAQIDPHKRELVQLGYNQAFEGHAPLAAYAFYFLNKPDFIRSNLTLRLAVAPVYLDSEVGVSQALGPNTDLGFGLAGGGYADSYSEIREGNYKTQESFDGHSGEVSVNVYHRFNPAQRVPLNAILRGEAHYSAFTDSDDTNPGFELPQSQPIFFIRSGLRLGGQEPLMLPELAMEVSIWYQGQFRTHSGAYGYGNDRQLNPTTHQFLGRGLFAYTHTNSGQALRLNLTLGDSIHADRFSAYRLGGFLPLASEFPLDLPGYYFQEISARRFALLGANYEVQLGRGRRVSALLSAATAGVDYIAGLKQPGGDRLSGVGAGLIYRSKRNAWQALVAYGYGIDALRNGEPGAHSIGFLVQFDLDRAGLGLLGPGESPNFSRALRRILNLF